MATIRQRMARRVTGSVVLVAAVAVALCWCPGTAKAAAPTQLAEVLVSDREQAACRPGHRDFVLEDVRDLYACVVLPGLEGTHYAQLTFVSPDGNVYQTMTVAFVTPDAPVTKQMLVVAGRAHKVKRVGWRARGESAVVVTLPVAGTHIAQHNLVGLWTVKMSLNGQPLDWGDFYLHPRR
jgi:hypothetical protein